MARNLASESKVLAMPPGNIIFFSFKFATATGSKFAKTSLQKTLLAKNFLKKAKNNAVKDKAFVEAVQIICK